MSARPLWQPRPRQWWGLGLILALGASPHLLRLPLWLSGIWLLALGWRLALSLRGRPMPTQGLRLLLTAAAAAGLYEHFGTVLGRDAGSALLVMMAGLKLLELRRRRDATLLVLLSYLLLATQFMFHQSVAQVAYAALAALGITSIWIDLSDPLGGRRWRDDWSLAARLLAQATPLMLILFLLFPRLPGPLWSLPADARSGRSGLSGEMEPGRISQLALSEAVAFRADFAGAVPPPAQRYWRGPVFEITDGRRWWGAADVTGNTETAVSVDTVAPPFQPLGAAYHYVMTLEPSSTLWLPALELPTTVPADLVRLPSLELKAKRAIDSLRRDAFTSYPEVRAGGADYAGRERNLRLPAAMSLRVQRLASGWRTAAATEPDVVAAALRYFNREPFAYTLEPPLLGADPIDTFLFETRRGFCEHYAAAFSILMRAAGIPARVVTGYQGGEVNPLGGYLIVRQSDAHAWAEVWLADSGWVRVDPTAAVAPERIERRIDLGRARAGDRVHFRLPESGLLGQALRRAQFGLDAMNNGWNQWVLSYGTKQQQRMLAGLGFADKNWRVLIWALLVGVAAMLALLAAVLLRRPRLQRDAAAVLYARFRRRLPRYGVRPLPQEGPQDLLARIEQARPASAAAARRITELYIALRYAPKEKDSAPRLQELRRAVRAF